MVIEAPLSLPELTPAGAGRPVVRLPELDNVPLTPAVVDIIDHPHFQRLRRVRQLGPTWLVYPGATHTRFEHAIGVYGTAVRYLRSLLQRPSVRLSLDEADVRTVLGAALLHDIGHYPFAHTLEALHRRGAETPRHEDLSGPIIRGTAPGLLIARDPIASLIERGLNVPADRVIALITSKRRDLARPVDRFLQSIISSAIDADKMDYLWRDSVHLGVPYGRNYDRDRLLNALTLNRDSDGIAVTTKGVVSAEIFLFCRYTMFSEVYWHHTVRAVSAMLEGAMADVVTREQPAMDELTSRLLTVGDDALLDTFFADAAPQSVAARLLYGLTGNRRRLYKRLMTWSLVADEPRRVAAYETLYALDSDGVTALVARLGRRFADILRRPVPDGSLLLDVPPRDKDHVPDLDVHDAGAGSFAKLADRSRIALGIAHDFVKVVKKIRLYGHPELAERLANAGVDVAAVVDDATEGLL